MREARGAHASLLDKPGLDLHEWETRWAELDDEIADDPAGTLSDAADFVEAMLGVSGYDLESQEAAEPAANMGEPTDLVEDYRAARDVADRVERGDEVERGDVEARAREPPRDLPDAVGSPRRLTGERRGAYRSASTDSRSAPVPTSVTGTPSASSTNAM